MNTGPKIAHFNTTLGMTKFGAAMTTIMPPSSGTALMSMRSSTPATCIASTRGTLVELKYRQAPTLRSLSVSVENSMMASGSYR